MVLIVFTIYTYQKVWILKWAPPEKSCTHKQIFQKCPVLA